MDLLSRLACVAALVTSGCIDWGSLYTPREPSAGGGACRDGAGDARDDTPADAEVVACAGGWELPGVVDAVPTGCEAAGDDSNNPDGLVCGVADLCGEGWHLCADFAEVMARVDGPGLCARLTVQEGDFFTTAQHGGAPSEGCTGADQDVNDLWGCGELGALITASNCGPLNRRVKIDTGDETTSCPAPWDCGDEFTGEAIHVIKRGAAAGGALCCLDDPP